MSDVGTILRDFEALRDAVVSESRIIIDRWRRVERPEFVESATNLAHYLALRRHDIRPLQRDLAALGLSSLGRAEARVMPTLDAVHDILLTVANGEPFVPRDGAGFFAGEARLRARTQELFVERSPHGPVNLLVTLPSEAADDPGFLHELAALGAEAVGHHDDRRLGDSLGHPQLAVAGGVLTMEAE